ncbi:MAG TPA: XrtA system polysaccharide deacetylase [Vicinamibacterales bacterium]|nr:XrtA system polysaccharide deacetylase [Vicinamibacterales bacterium]
MTVDVEDYFQASAFDRVVSRAEWYSRDSRVVANTHTLLEFFHRHRVRGTFFILGWVAERFPSLVREIATCGHELASHGFHHQLIYNLTRDQFRDDVRRAKAVIEDAGGCPVRGYRAPSFSIVRSSLWALDVLIEEGHGYDASIFPIHHDRYGIPDAPRTAHVIERSAGAIVEVPASTVRVGKSNLPIAGGGYFRLLPYAFTKWGISRVNASGQPVVFYIHPWEIDPAQPRLPVSRLTALRHYSNLDDTLNRLERMVADFAFDTIAATLDVGAPAPAAAVRFAHAK